MSTRVKCFGSFAVVPSGITGTKSSSTSQGKCRAIVLTLGAVQSGPHCSTSYSRKSATLVNIRFGSRKKSEGVLSSLDKMYTKEVMGYIDLSGKRFGRLVVGERMTSSTGKSYWICECDCGNSKSILGESLRNGKTKSCGCFRKEATSASFKVHGKCKSAEYQSWQSMHSRCSNINNQAYWRYGGRGIKVCARWSSFANFHADMGDKPDPSMSIDRIDNDLGYSPENCRWATDSEQARNKRNTLMITYKGVDIPVADLADYLKVNYFTFLDRLNKAKEKYENGK